MSSRFSETELVRAHSHSSHNLEEVQKSSNCGCFSCLKIFSSSEITEWLADGTVLCPDCGVDSVLGSMSGYPLTKDFLAEMNGRWFRKITRPSRQMRFRWRLLEGLGGIVTLFGTLAILPGCPYFLLFAYGPCSVSTIEGETGFVMAVAGAVLIIVGELGRRKNRTPKPPSV